MMGKFLTVVCFHSKTVIIGTKEEKEKKTNAKNDLTVVYVNETYCIRSTSVADLELHSGGKWFIF